MQIILSEDVQCAIEQSVKLKMAISSVLDVETTAEEIRLTFVERNIAREDIATSVAQFATRCGYPMELTRVEPAER